ncbi:MAG: diguanylate cyclase domain-containing protein [Leptonema sp. (in: bacteria)]
MGLFEKALSFQKEKKGLYHKLLEYKKKWEEEPKSLYLKAKKLRELLEKANSFNFPKFKLEKEAPKELDPELNPIQSSIESQKDLFEDWEEEAKKEMKNIQTLEKKEEIEKKIIEDDSEILTLPEEIHIASQKRIDYYLSLFDINEELQEIEHFDEFLENLAFIIQEQLGTRSLLVFGNKEFPQSVQRLENLFEIGYKSVDFFIPLKDPIFTIFNNSNEIHYITTLERDLKQKESIYFQFKEIFNDFSIALLLKIDPDVYGLVLLSKPLDQPDYVLDDLEFLRILTKIALSKIKQLKRMFELEKKIQNVQKFNQYSKSIFKFLLDCSNKKNMDEIYDLLEELLDKEFGIGMSSFIVIVPNQGYYKLFSGKNISLESLEKFHLDINSDLVSLISNLTTVHPLENFRSYQDVVNNYSEEDISLMQNFIIFPLVHLNWLVGFLVIHKFKKEWDSDYEEALLYLSTYLATLVTNLVLSEEKELIFRDTFSPLRKKIEFEIQKAEETQSSFSIVDIKIKNFKKLLSVNQVSKMDQYLRKLIDIIHSTLYKHDYLVRLAHARFVIILTKKSKEESQIYLKKLLAKINETNIFYDSPIQPIYTYEIFSYPKDADNLKKFLALIEI